MLTHRITLFHLFGFKIQLDASWALLAVLIVWSLAAGVFPRFLPGHPASTYWWMGVVGLIGLAASIVTHELAHALVARRHEMPIRAITLFIFGGVAEMEREPPSAKAEFWVAIAGPIMSLAVAFLFAALAGLAGGIGGEGPPFDEPEAVPPLALVFSYLALINIMLAVFNMVPAFPLDGGRILRAAIWGWGGDIVRATRIAAIAGSGFAFVLMAYALVNLMAGNVIGGVWLFVLGLFLHMAAQGQVAFQRSQHALGVLPVRRLMRTEVVGVSPDLRVEALVRDFFYRYFFKSFPVIEGERLVGIVDVAAVRRAADPATTRVRDVMRPADDSSVVAPDLDAAEALRLMQRAGRSRLLVVERERLVGVLSLRDLIRYLALREQLGDAAEAD